MVTKEGFDLYRAFLDGDLSALANKLRSSSEISPEVRNLLADILEGNLKRPRHRPRGLTTDERHAKIAKRVLQIGGKRGAAIRQAASDFRVSDSTVKIALRKHRLKEAAELEVNAQYESQLRKALARTLTSEEVERVIKHAREEGVLRSSK